MSRSLIRVVRRAIQCVTRNIAKISMVAITAAVLTAPINTQAQQQQTVKFKENNRIEANGNGHFCYEIKLPVAAYTQLKRNTPNTAVLLRKLGLNTQNVLVENVQGTWDDGNSTLKIEYGVKGVARAGKDLVWEVPLFDGLDTELVAVTDGFAILTQANNIPGLGLATSTIRVELPAGAFDVKALKNPSRLSYKMNISNSVSGNAKGDFEVEVKPQLMSALAKAHSNKKFAALHAARSQFKNSGEQTLKDYRVRFRIAEYAPSWSAWQGTSLVVPGQTVIDTYYPIFEMEKIGKLTGSTKVAVEVQYQYTTAAGQKVEETETKELTLLSRNQVYYTGMNSEDCVDFYDQFQLSDVILASFVTHEDPVIQQAAGRIANAIGGANAAGSDAEAQKFMKAVYDFMSKNIAYQTPPGGESDHKLMQHVKYGRDVLKNKAGTCIDLAILYGSLCEAVGLEPVLYIIPGHCFPAVRMPVSGTIIPIEATLIGKCDFLASNKYALDNNMNPMFQGKKPYMAADIVKLHNMGVQPIDLPYMAEDVLNQWGMNWNFTATQPKAQQTDTPAPAKLNPKFFGTWANTGTFNGKQQTEKFIFGNDGQFLIVLIIDGQVTNIPGTYTSHTKGVRFTYKSNGNSTDAMIYLRSDSEMVITMDDGSQSVLFRQ